MRAKWLLTLCMLALASPAQAALLTDGQLYFDFPSLVDGYYEETYLPHLGTEDAVVWAANADPVIDADILPGLKEGIYGPGHVYSQADYYRVPNVDYTADLSAGTLTATFSASGPYHVRITRQTGAEAVYAIHAESTPLGDPPRKTGGSKKSAVPPGDLFLVSKETGPDDYIDAAYQALVHHHGGEKVEKVDDLADVIDKAKTLGKSHIELVGHGGEGKISMGSDELGSINLHTFLTTLKQQAPNLKHLSFVSCYTAKKDWFLEDVKNVIGKASGYAGYIEAVVEKDKETGEVEKAYFSGGGEHKIIPEPSAWMLAVLGALLLAWRKSR